MDPDIEPPPIDGLVTLMDELLARPKRPGLPGSRATWKEIKSGATGPMVPVGSLLWNTESPEGVTIPSDSTNTASPDIFPSPPHRQLSRHRGFLKVALAGGGFWACIWLAHMGGIGMPEKAQGSLKC